MRLRRSTRSFSWLKPKVCPVWLEFRRTLHQQQHLLRGSSSLACSTWRYSVGYSEWAHETSPIFQWSLNQEGRCFRTQKSSKTSSCPCFLTKETKRCLGIGCYVRIRTAAYNESGTLSSALLDPRSFTFQMKTHGALILCVYLNILNIYLKKQNLITNFLGEQYDSRGLETYQDS